MRTSLAVGLLVAGTALIAGPPAVAVFTPGVVSPPRSDTNTELVMSGTGPGQGVTGFIADASNPFDPIASGYPTLNPTSGWSAKSEDFAGVIHATPKSGGPTLNMYCIDLRTLTETGIGYVLGTWDEAHVPRVGYVARALNAYYPNTNEPATLPTPDQKAAAVQAAIWFFSDRYVLDTSDPLHDTVAAIVSAVIAAGPIVTPPPPSLTITPKTVNVTAGVPVGPFTVTSAVANATVTAIGASMFSDAAETVPVTNGATVASGTRIWLKLTGPSAAVLLATARTTVPTGNVYLYDGNTPGTADAQELILAQTSTLKTTVSATAQFHLSGSLVIEKTIAGPAAGAQGRVTMQSTCDGAVLTPDFVIPGGTGAGVVTHTYRHIAAGARCTVIETGNGGTSTIDVVVTGSGNTVTIPTGGSVTAPLTDTYTAPHGGLLVRKTITGPAAGSQAAVVIQPTCNGRDLVPFVIAAGTNAGARSHFYARVAAGAVCTITETVDGHNNEATVAVDGSGQHVTVAAGTITTADLTDTYDFAPGSLTVTKTITGPAAGQQGQVTIVTTCGGTPLSPPFVIPAGTTTTSSLTYDDIPGGSLCRVVETADGHAPTVNTRAVDSGHNVVIPPGGTATVPITNTYDTGSLIVNKTITGPAAGSQGDVTIHVVCNGTAQADFVIPAGTAAGTVSREYPGIIAGATCTVTESTDGSTATVTVATDGSPQDVVIGANASGTADVTDTYAFVPGSLTVTKNLTGSAAADHGDVSIEVVCDGTTLTPTFAIAAGAAGPVSHTYTGVPGNAVCTVDETANGSTSTVGVTVDGDGQSVTVPPAGDVTATITDTYEPLPGALVVSKTITGSAAGRQGPVTIGVTCGSTALPDFVIPGGTAASTVSNSYENIPANSTCTVSETQDGATGTIDVAVDGGDQTVTVGAAAEASAAITDTYTDVPGSLTVTKTITGPSAGSQGDIALLVDCSAPNVFTFAIPAATTAGPVARTYDNLPAGSVCTVTEVIDGSTTDVDVATVGSGQQVTVAPAATAAADVSDTYTPAAGGGATTTTTVPTSAQTVPTSSTTAPPVNEQGGPGQPGSPTGTLPNTGAPPTAPTLEVGLLSILFGLLMLLVRPRPHVRRA